MCFNCIIFNIIFLVLPPPQYTEVAQPVQPPPSYDEIERVSMTPLSQQNQTGIGGITTTLPQGPEPSSPAVLPYPPPTMMPPEPSSPAVLPYPPLEHGNQLSSTLHQPPVAQASHQQQQQQIPRTANGAVLFPPPPSYQSEMMTQSSAPENLDVIRVSPTPPP